MGMGRAVLPREIIRCPRVYGIGREHVSSEQADALLGVKTSDWSFRKNSKGGGVRKGSEEQEERCTGRGVE